MAVLVFYCSNCEQTLAGKDYQATERPHCPKCNKKTLSTGITKDVWFQKTKEERQEILEALLVEDEQREQSIAKREEYAQTVGVTYKEKDDETANFLDSIYTDIGRKIKGWAKWIFIIEAIAAIIAGFGLMAYDATFIGLLVLACGPLIAWVSSWILYAFGELVDKTCDNERNTQNILKLMLESNAQKD